MVDFIKLVGLDGACSNQNSAAHDRLALINSTRERILDQVGLAAVMPKQCGELRKKSVQPVIERVLIRKREPMRMYEVHSAVETKLGRPICRSTIKNGLLDLMRKSDSPVERVGYGVYQASHHA